MAETLRGKLNPIYASLFSSPIFDRPEVVETRATCDTCAMCDQGQLAPVEMDYFNPNTKCCTFFPTLPNYLVGAILADTGEELAEGRKRLRERIGNRIGVTPLFMLAPTKYNLLYAASRGRAFGRSKMLLCPYYDGEGSGRCTVWRYREAVCSTYFCKHTHGKPGWQLWQAMKGYLSHVERSLARASAMSIDANVKQPTREAHELSLEELEDRGPSETEYAGFWGKWVGREEEFYVACYKRALAMSTEDFARNIDDSPDGRGFLGELEARYEAIQAKTILPKSLVRTPGMRTRHTGEQVVVASYNVYDSFAMERELYDVLGMLDGTKTLAENLERLDREENVQLAPELLQYLYVHGVVDAPAPAKPAEKSQATQPERKEEASKVTSQPSLQNRRGKKKK